MQPRRVLLPLLALFASACISTAASLSSFIVVYGQITNDIAAIQNAFDNSAAQKEKLATLVRARDAILDPAATDVQALATVANVLAPYPNYTPLVDEAARNVRTTFIDRYRLLGERVALLPPGARAVRAASAYNNLEPAITALASATHGNDVSTQATALTRRLDLASRLIDRATLLMRPLVGVNRVVATVNRRGFISGASGAHSATVVSVTAPGAGYREVYFRAVDGTKVLTITLPAVTQQQRYEIQQGLATVTFEPDVFATNRTTLTASTGTFWIQNTRTEIYGLFSCTGDGLSITNGRFRVQVPRSLWR